MTLRAQAKKGIVLIVVLGMVLMVAILAQVILRLILSHSRFTHHQTSRIQAYYAAMAGTNLALENLRTGTWTFGPNTCPTPDGCVVTDTDFPSSIQSIRVIFCPSGSICAGSINVCNPPSGNNFCIQTITTYTYTPP